MNELWSYDDHHYGHYDYLWLFVWIMISSFNCTFNAVAFSRDPANFYADKVNTSFERGDMDTAGRIILTCSTVCVFKVPLLLFQSLVLYYRSYTGHQYWDWMFCFVESFLNSQRKLRITFTLVRSTKLLNSDWSRAVQLVPPFWRVK